MEAWMHPKEKELITKHFSPEKTMLEWGSGGSTVEFAPFVKKLYSIEHNMEWYLKVSDELNRRNLQNVDYNFVAQNEDRTGGQSTYPQFKDYIDKIDEFDEKFDIVLIDGRARRLCAYKVIPYLNPGAVVVIHDWVLRHVYHCVTDHYNVLEYVGDTFQTIATFTLRDTPAENAYDLTLGEYERDDLEKDNYFKNLNK